MRRPISLLNCTLLSKQFRDLPDNEAATVCGGGGGNWSGDTTTTTTTVQYSSGIKYPSYFPGDPIIPGDPV